MVGYDRNKQIVYTHRVLTFKKHTKKLLSQVLQELIIDVEDVIVSCVVPRIEQDIIETIESVLNIKPIMIKGATIDKMKINIDNHLELGADLICTSIGAASKYNTPVIVADIGSATKLTLTNVDNVYEGGIILPGLGSSLQSIGKNTISAIQSGMLYGVVAQIEGLANRFEKELNKKCERVLTGGYTVLFKHMLPEFHYEAYLVNDGLIEIYLKDMYKKTLD